MNTQRYGERIGVGRVIQMGRGIEACTEQRLGVVGFQEIEQYTCSALACPLWQAQAQHSGENCCAGAAWAHSCLAPLVLAGCCCCCWSPEEAIRPATTRVAPPTHVIGPSSSPPSRNQARPADHSGLDEKMTWAWAGATVF